MSITIAGVSVAALVVGVTELIKKRNYLADRYVPLVPFVLGAFLSALAQYSAGGIVLQSVVSHALVLGLMANGLYSGGKKSLLNK